MDFELPSPQRRIFCNRTLNLRSIRAIGFDMDYTLIHYRTEVWERHAYHHAKQRLLEKGWPVEHLEFDPSFASLGLILDLELGNVVKANRFGYVKKACHGTRDLSFEKQRAIYAREIIELADPRWRFMNTLFALSEACLFAQCVDLLDDEKLEELGQPMAYRDVYAGVRSAIDEAHMMGELKRDIMADPERFVDLDEELPLALMDLRAAGKKVLLITNSEWFYTRAMMSYAFDRFLPGDMTWKELFDLVVVAARKPSFFEGDGAVFEVVDEVQGTLKPVVGPLQPGGFYVGGHARLVEQVFDIAGQQVLYVGDHIFSDVNRSKKILRWRTALVVRELEQDLEALEGFKPQQAELTRMMAEKERLEHAYSQVRLLIQRKEKGYGPQAEESAEALRERMQAIREEVLALDARIAPLAKEASELSHPRWGLVMRAGNDKSHLARQVEKSADVYMARVSNLLAETPFVYLRSPRTSLPHDHGPSGGA
ncbi:MAG: HAD family hydrolase [Sandaracinus sp.]|nr:HAD family hydrolase [Myxococcales bacterium]MAT23527.1 HAD family hydrolase [Sandaracinus sp.]MBJ72073.1 HAD family hydrolase [Sandaracinus sp.]